MSSARRRSILSAAIGCCFSIATACTSSNPDGQPVAPLPPAIRAACGHPGATARLDKLPVTVRHHDCDLTGVAVSYGQTGVTVPSSGTVGAVADGISSSTTLVADVDPKTGDITFHE